MQRIVIIGNAGGGKSTFAHKLGSVLNLPVHHLDNLWKRADCTPVSARKVTKDILAITQHPAWIVEGWMPFEALPTCLERADTIVYVKHRLWIHLWWVFKREIKEHTIGVAPFEHPCLRGPFLSRVVRTVWGIWKTYQPMMLAMVAPHRGQKRVIDIQSPHQFHEFLDQAGQPNSTRPYNV